MELRPRARLLLFCTWQLCSAIAFTNQPTYQHSLGISSNVNPIANCQRLHSTATDENSNSIEQIPSEARPKVQRYYNDYHWTNPDSKKTHKINYRVEGKPTDPPILLIHGFGANVNHFRYNFPALTEAGYRVYAVDLLGFGGSDKPKDEDYAIELWVNLP